MKNINLHLFTKLRLIEVSVFFLSLLMVYLTNQDLFSGNGIQESFDFLRILENSALAVFFYYILLGYLPASFFGFWLCSRLNLESKKNIAAVNLAILLLHGISFFFLLKLHDPAILIIPLLSIIIFNLLSPYLELIPRNSGG